MPLRLSTSAQARKDFKNTSYILRRLSSEQQLGCQNYPLEMSPPE